MDSSTLAESPLDSAAQKTALRFVLLTVFIYAMGFGIIMPVLPALIMELEGVSLSEATQLGAWVGASYAIAQFVMGPVVGNLSDRFGRRPVFMISLLGFGIDFLLMGMATSIVWLFVGRAIAGGFGAIFGPANSTVADLIDPERRAQHFGYVGAAFGIGFIVGPALGGYLAALDLRLPFFVAGICALINLVYGYFAFPETLPAAKRRPLSIARANPLGALLSLSQERRLMPLAAAYLIWVSATNIYPTSWTFFARASFNWDSQTIGLSLTLVGVSMALTQIFIIKRSVARFGEAVTAMIGIAVATLFFILLAAGMPGSIVLPLTIFMGLQGMVLASINALMSKLVSPSNQGELQGFNGSLAALALLVAQIGYNSLLSYYTSEAAPVYFPGAPFLLAAGLGIIAWYILYYQSRSGRK